MSYIPNPSTPWFFLPTFLQALTLPRARSGPGCQEHLHSPGQVHMEVSSAGAGLGWADFGILSVIPLSSLS